MSHGRRWENSVAESCIRELWQISIAKGWVRKVESELAGKWPMMWSSFAAGSPHEQKMLSRGEV